MVMIVQVGEDCEVTLKGDQRLIKRCNATKLSNTLWDKEGEQYTEEQMDEWGFCLKKCLKLPL